jgi:hypothetical protein
MHCYCRISCSRPDTAHRPSRRTNRGRSRWSRSWPKRRRRFCKSWLCGEGGGECVNKGEGSVTTGKFVPNRLDSIWNRITLSVKKANCFHKSSEGISRRTICRQSLWKIRKQFEALEKGRKWVARRCTDPQCKRPRGPETCILRTDGAGDSWQRNALQQESDESPLSFRCFEVHTWAAG